MKTKFSYKILYIYILKFLCIKKNLEDKNLHKNLIKISIKYRLKVINACFFN